MLFRVIAELKAQGVGIVYISHRLEELIRIGDYITVLRDGAITGARPMAGVDIPLDRAGDDRRRAKEFPRTERPSFGDEVLRAGGRHPAARGRRLRGRPRVARRAQGRDRRASTA